MRGTVAGLVMLGLVGCGPASESPEVTDPVIDEPRWVFPADGPSPVSVILHAGHGGWTASLTRAAERFAESGYTTYRLEMPPTPHGPEDDFLGPTFGLVDDLTAEGQTVVMVGISGGGWTTTMATALDARIAKGYSVAGDLPVDLRAPQDPGDWEQQHPPVDYREAYQIAEGRLLHLFIWQDTCCFAGVSGEIGTPYLTDYTVRGHLISEWAVGQILEDIRANVE